MAIQYHKMAKAQPLHTIQRNQTKKKKTFGYLVEHILQVALDNIAVATLMI